MINNNVYHTDTNQSVEDTRPTDAPYGASAGAKAPAATSSSDGAGGWQVAGRRSTGGKTTRGKRGGRAHRKGGGGGGGDRKGRPSGGKTEKPSKTHKITFVVREVTPSRAERVALKDVAIAAAVAMRKKHGKFFMNVERAEAEQVGPCEFAVLVVCQGDDTPALIDEYNMLIHENVERHNASVIVTEHSATTVSTTSEVVRASGGGAAAPVEQGGVISVPTKGSNGLYECRMKLASGLTTERGHSFVGIAISLCKNYAQKRWGKVIVEDVTDTHCTIKAREEVLTRFRATLLTRRVNFEMRVEADIGACEVAARKVGKQINALDKVRATIDTADIKFVGKVAVVPCSVSLSAVDLFREAFTTQIKEVPSAPRGEGGASKKARFARDIIPCDSAEKAHDCYMSAVKVAKKLSRNGVRVKVFPYDGKSGSEICVSFSCEEDAVEPFKEQVIKQVAFDDKKAAECLMFEGSRINRVYDSPWAKKVLEYVTKKTDMSFMFTGRVMIFENAVTGESALAEDLPVDVSRGRVPRVGPVPLWIETRRSAFSEYVLRSDSKMLSEEEEDKVVAEVNETLEYFERNTYSIPNVKLGRDSLAFKALELRNKAMFAKQPKKGKYDKDMFKIHPDRQVKVIAKRVGEGPVGPTVEFVCEAATELANVPNYVKSVWRELRDLYYKGHLGASMRSASYNWLDRARSTIAVRREVEKERAQRMAVYKQKMAERQAAVAQLAKERMIAPMEKTPAPEHDSGDDEEYSASSNPFGALLVAEVSSVAATKGGAAMVEPKKSAPKKTRGIALAVDYGIVGSKGGRK